MTTHDMSHKPVALVTGGAGEGIGHGISSALARRGWHVVIADRAAGQAADLAASLSTSGLSAAAVNLDVSDEGDVERTVAAIVTEHDSIGLLVNSAGVGLISPVAEVTAEQWDRLFSVDLRGAWLVARACLRHMVPRRSGVLIHLGSVQALGAASGYGVYAAAKSGIIGMSRAIAADYGPLGIRSVVVHPGMVDSPQNREIFRNFGDPERFIDDYLSSRQMIPHLLTPEDIGNVVAFLASAEAAGITGTEIVVDGGSSAMAFDRRGDS